MTSPNYFPALRVLIVEDEADLRDAMTDYLRLEGCAATGACTIAECLPWLEAPEGGVIVLDLGLPNGDGLIGLKPHLDGRRHGLVLATARGRIEDRLRGYEEGGDAYLVKPVDLRELTCVVRGVASRLKAGDTAGGPLRYWTLHEVGWRLISPQGVACRLTNYETRLLNLLATSPGQVVARERLILALGQEPTAYDPRNLEILVRRLRRKSVQDLGEELPLATAHGVGYAFLADIRVVQ